MNVGGDLVRNGAKVDGVRFHDGIKGSAGDEIEVDYLENSSKLTMEGNAEHVNVGGAVRYIHVYEAERLQVQRRTIYECCGKYRLRRSFRICSAAVQR